LTWTAADLGLAVHAGAAAKSKGPAVQRPPKYMDPKTSKTWNGHGKAPQWIAEATRKGRRDDFLIERVAAAMEKKAVAKSPAAAASGKAKNAVASKATTARKSASPRRRCRRRR